MVRRKKFKHVPEYLHKYPNLLNREFTAERPNQKWVTDISYIPTAQENCYLSIIRDFMTTQLSHFDYSMKKNANSKIFSCKNALNLSQKKLLQESAVFLKTTYKK